MFVILKKAIFNDFTRNKKNVIIHPRGCFGFDGNIKKLDGKSLSALSSTEK